MGVAVSVAEGIVVTEGMGNAVKGGGVVTVTSTDDTGATFPQAPISNVMRSMENTINTHFGVFISILIANSRG